MANVTAVGVNEQKVAGALRLTITSPRRLWSSWHDTKRDRRLTASNTQVMAFAQAGLRQVTGRITLTVVAVSGGPSVWDVLYEIPVPAMDVAAISSLSDQVQQKLSRLVDANSPEFAAFTQGATSAGSSLQLQSVAVLKHPTLVLSAELASGAVACIASKGIFTVALLALLGVVLGHC